MEVGEHRTDRTAESKKAVLDALRNTLGIVTPAVEEVGIARSTFYRWMQEDTYFKTEVEDIQNVALDFAESKLLQSIKNGSDTATIFYLKTKGKKRGYVERTEHDHSGNMNINWFEQRTYDSDEKTDTGT